MSDEAKDIFFEKIIKNKIKPPTQTTFSIEKWHKEWANIDKKSSKKDQNVYKAGIIIDSVLSQVREELIELYKKAPKTTYERLMLSYVALSNRTTTVALKLAKQKPTTNIQAVLLKANMAGTEQGLVELVHGAVDGVQLAIRGCLRNIKNGNTIKVSKEPIEEIEFIQQESWLSELYSTYIHLWQCVLWSDYDLVKEDEEQKFYSIKQPNTSYEIAFMNSINRKERLSGQGTLMAMKPLIQHKFSDDKYLVIKRENKKRVALVQCIKHAGDKLITWNTQWRIQEMDLQSNYPKKWLNDNYDQGFCISDALDVMRCLMLMANKAQDKFPENDSAFNVSKLNEFCPTVQAFSLKRSLCDATGLEADKVNKIVDFMTVKSSSTSDLWCQPLIKTSKNEYALMVSALLAPSLPRVFERWADEFSIDLAEKGYTYEETVIEELNDALESNKLVVDYDKGVSKRIKLGVKKEEEFDLLARVDNMIIIGEAKSIVTTDSEISKYRTSKILQHAGEQVIRKTKFLKENLQVIFERLNWTYDVTKEYQFVQCILNSSAIFVGHKFNDVSVIDTRILSAYFSSNQINLMTVASQESLKTIAWYNLYENITELKANFQTYVSNPPQLNECKDAYKYNNIGFPYISDDSFKLSKRYFVLKETEVLAVMDREHHFPVIKSDDYDVESAQVKVTM